ncbi:MAG: hypothetical protein ACOY94_15040 [Bacillota bacterium]
MNAHYDYALMNKMLTRETQNPHQDLHRADALEAYRSQRAAQRAEKRFFQLYTLRNLLLRYTPSLAKRLAL